MQGFAYSKAGLRGETRKGVCHKTHNQVDYTILTAHASDSVHGTALLVSVMMSPSCSPRRRLDSLADLPMDNASLLGNGLQPCSVLHIVLLVFVYKKYKSCFSHWTKDCVIARAGRFHSHRCLHFFPSASLAFQVIPTRDVV